jgi:anti-sigma B factor antagonist
MKILTKKSRGHKIIALDGDMTIYQAADIKAQLFPILAKTSDIEIDLSLVKDMDSTGLQILMLAKRELTKRDGHLRLIAHSRAVLDIFELCNIANYFGDPLLIPITI